MQRGKTPQDATSTSKANWLCVSPSPLRPDSQGDGDRTLALWHAAGWVSAPCHQRSRFRGQSNPVSQAVRTQVGTCPHTGRAG